MSNTISKYKYPLTIEIGSVGTYSTSIFLLNKHDLKDENQLVFINKDNTKVVCSYDYRDNPYKAKIEDGKNTIVRFKTIQELKTWIKDNIKR